MTLIISVFPVNTFTAHDNRMCFYVLFWPFVAPWCLGRMATQITVCEMNLESVVYHQWEEQSDTCLRYEVFRYNSHPVLQDVVARDGHAKNLWFLWVCLKQHLMIAFQYFHHLWWEYHVFHLGSCIVLPVSFDRLSGISRNLFFFVDMKCRLEASSALILHSVCFFLCALWLCLF